MITERRAIFIYEAARDRQEVDLRLRRQMMGIPVCSMRMDKQPPKTCVCDKKKGGRKK